MSFLLDSNIYIDSFNDAVFGEELRRFQQGRIGKIFLSAVVAFELRVRSR